ncbi:MAG: polymer-forming cytoskeletal protein [Sneathiella sp.]|uniref:bactofilin family protein n=1 Tax=Sneathiella sp. TaxID=1964365 RepID=UPI003002976E
MFQKKTKLTDAPETEAEASLPQENPSESRVKPMTNNAGGRTYGVDNALRPKTPVYGQPPEEKKQGSRLHVGADIHLKGEITACDRLIVEGKVEASMDSKEIEISKSGVFIGTVDIDTADISGKFDGTMKARKRLIIRKTGHVTGNISYGEIEIEPGGEIGGSLKKVGKEQPNLLADIEKDVVQKPEPHKNGEASKASA